VKRLLLAGLAVASVLTVADQADAASGRCPQYERLLAAHHLPVQRFSRIMYRESRCKPGVTNRRSGAAGLLQIMPAHAGRWRTCPGQNLYSASGNVACAARLYRKAGMAPWRL
jgi:soluble lytic murein transglycosylase-like protein